VHYALRNGQSPNSNLDGVLPLHTACAGGSELVVQLLIDAGADVNAARSVRHVPVPPILVPDTLIMSLRLPRKHSSDKSKHPSDILVGATGSTPLHFAAANGHAAIVRILLASGANPEKVDKDGLTPEEIASSIGQDDVVAVLRAWEAMRWANGRVKSPTKNDSSSIASGSSNATIRGDRGEISPTASTFSVSSRSRKVHAKRSVEKLDSVFYRRAPPPPEKPPIPQSLLPLWTPVQEVPAPHPIPEITHRRPSLPSALDQALPTSKPSSSSSHPSRRPRSAGQGQEESTPSTPPAGIRKLGSKYSLLNLFKKSNDSAPSSNNISPIPSSPRRRSTDGYSRSTSPSPGPNSPNDPNVTEFNTGPIPTSSSPPIRARTDSNASSVSPGSSPPAISSMQHWRSRRPSEVTAPSPLATEWVGEPEDMEEEAVVIDKDKEGDGELELFSASEDEQQSGRDNPQPRSSIVGPLGGHRHPSRNANRLRFDASATSSASPRGPRSSSSVGSFASRRSSRASSTGDGVRFNDQPSYSAQPEESNNEDDGSAVEVDEEADEVGEPLWTGPGRPKVFGRVSSSSRKQSFNSSGSGSPRLSPEGLANAGTTDFPFEAGRGGVTTTDTRLRGDSISSMSTDGSTYQNLTASPWSTDASLPSLSQAGSYVKVPSFTKSQSSGPHRNSISSLEEKIDLGSPNVSSRRTHHIPLMLRNVSTHAQAQSLVHKAQQDILDFDLTPDSPISLTAQLAAYGETLALERRFAKGEAQKDAKTVTPGDSGDEEEEEKSDSKYPTRLTATVFAKTPSPRVLNRAVSLDQRLQGARSLSSGTGRLLRLGNSSPGHQSPPSADSLGYRVTGMDSKPYFRTSPPAYRGRHRQRNGSTPIFHHASPSDPTADANESKSRLVDRVGGDKDRSSIEIFRTLPTPTDSPKSLTYDRSPTDDSREYDFRPFTKQEAVTGSSNAYRSPTPDVMLLNNGRPIPLTRTFTAPDNIARIHSRSSSMTDVPNPPQRSVTPLMGVADYALEPQMRGGKRTALKSLFKTITGK
jgi:hypothetical protein